MMRSLFSGVAGLKTHQTKMDVIGNNIANVNTTAFKSSSIVFSELMSQTTQRASGANATTGTGGTNARQIGLGVKSGAINVNITGQGSSQSTGNPFDIMITGDNFFVVNNGTENFFTRDGSFYVDGAGNLAMTSTGYNVMGWQVDDETGDIKQDTVAALRIMSAVNMTYPPEATTQAVMDGIIDKNDKDVTSKNGKVVNLNFFDALGYAYTAKFVFRKSDSPEDSGGVNNYSLELDRILDSTGKVVYSASEEGAANIFGTAGNSQNIAGKLTIDTKNYSWDTTNTKQLKDKDGNIIADLATIVDGSGNMLDRDAETMLTTGTPPEPLTVQNQLDAIAKAYGYEGSTDDFLNLLYTPVSQDAAGADVVHPQITVEQMLLNLANGTNTTTNPDQAHFPTDVTSFETSGRRFDGTIVAFDGKTGKFAGIQGQETVTTAVMNLSALGGNFSNITVDLSGLGMYDNKGTSTAAATSGDEEGLGMGRRLGDMIGVSIQQDGRIYASYDNGMTRLLGQIATAAFANASGLQKSGDNLYSATLNSGEFDGIGVNVTANGGYMSTGQLEMSNVDLSAEFTEMITTQRGFQANSRIITVSDTLLEELTNLKR